MFVKCEVDDPNSLRYCDQRELDIPYLAQFKLAGMYPLPFELQVSGSWQGYPGVPSGTARQDVRVQPDAQPGRRSVAERELHRRPDDRADLTQTSVTVPLLEAGLRSTSIAGIRSTCGSPRSSRSAALQAQGQFDIFNLLNSNSILSDVETFGTSLDRPSSILQGRLFAVGVQLTF